MVKPSASSKDTPLAPQPERHVGSSVLFQLLLGGLTRVGRGPELFNVFVKLLLNLHLLLVFVHVLFS